MPNHNPPKTFLYYLFDPFISEVVAIAEMTPRMVHQLNAGSNLTDDDLEWIPEKDLPPWASFEVPHLK